MSKPVSCPASNVTNLRDETLDTRVIVVGAGLGGLATAALLLDRGYSVRVFEQAARLGEIGAGIQISANAAHVLAALGLNERVVPLAVTPASFRFHMHDSGELLHEIPLGAAHELAYGASYFHLHRADLHAALADKVASLDADAIVLGARAVSFTEDDDAVTVGFADGSSATGHLLVAADGIRSNLRRLIVGEVDAEFTGYVAWRAMVPATRLPADYMERVCSIWVGPSSHTVTYYVRAGEILNFIGLVESAAWRDESWTVKGAWADLKADFAAFHAHIQLLLDALPKDQCYRWALYDRVPARGWSTARATLLGDAAHATLPFMAQGAAMALEDGAVLARSLDGRDIRAALELFEHNRYERTSRVQVGSREQGELYRLKTPRELSTGFAARGLGHASDAWLYAYNPITVPLEEPRPAQ